jgi:hypothetical protein
MAQRTPELKASPTHFEDNFIGGVIDSGSKLLKLSAARHTATPSPKAITV